MEWNGMENGMEWNGNFGMEYGRCQIGMEDFKNGTEDNLPYFHTNSILDLGHCIHKKNTYRCRVVIDNIVTEVFNSNIYAYYLSINRNTLVFILR